MGSAVPQQATPKQSTDFVRQIKEHDHACFIYDRDSELLEAAGAFLREGFEAGAKCLYITADRPVSDCRRAFKEAGIPVEQGEADGRFGVLTKDQAYLRGGGFDPDEMVAFLEGAVRAEKGRSVRGSGDMAWALGSELYLPKLILYESKVNQIFGRQPFGALCFYDRRRFPARVLNEVVRVHPIVLYGGRAIRNPFYVPPSDYLTGAKGDAILNATLEDLLLHSDLEPDVHGNGAVKIADLRGAGPAN